MASFFFLQVAQVAVEAGFMASFFFLQVAQVAVEAATLDVPESDELQVPFHCIRRRFSKGQTCEVYRGQDGWVSARVEEETCLTLSGYLV